jgi:APA family basic amino acid/polyamine antiporter
VSINSIKPKLERRLGLTSLAATGICSMLGASIYIVPFMIQRNVEGIGPYVVPAFIFAAIPAIFAAIAYAALSTAMPVAGGSYIYASRGLNPYLGFIASFSQWFGLSIAIGVIAYVIVPFFRDIAVALDWTNTAEFLDQGINRVIIALLLLWSFVIVNILGLELYKRTMVPMMLFMFLLGALVIIIGFSNDHESFSNALGAVVPASGANSTFHLGTFLTASAVLFASFIGFDSIAQAGGEASNPTRNLPLATILTITLVGIFYVFFTSAVYHAVPWSFVQDQAQKIDITAPGLLSPLLSPTTAALIILGAAVALINDLPAMLLSVSRLMFAWAQDGIFPAYVAKVHSFFHTPYLALITSGAVATLGILGSHFAGDFFLGVDIMVTSMLINFLLMCLTLGKVYKTNKTIASEMTLLKSKSVRKVVSYTGFLFLFVFLFVHISKDLSSNKEWFLKSTPVWLLVMSFGTVVYLIAIKKLKRKGTNIKELFNKIPE